MIGRRPKRRWPAALDHELGRLGWSLALYLDGHERGFRGPAYGPVGARGRPPRSDDAISLTALVSGQPARCRDVEATLTAWCDRRASAMPAADQALVTTVLIPLAHQLAVAWEQVLGPHRSRRVAAFPEALAPAALLDLVDRDPGARGRFAAAWAGIDASLVDPGPLPPVFS